MHEVFNIIRDYNAIMPPFVNTYLPPSQHYYAETILNATVSLIFAVLLIGIIGRGWRSTTYFYLGEIGPRPIATNYCRCTLKTRVQLALPKWLSWLRRLSLQRFPRLIQHLWDTLKKWWSRVLSSEGVVDIALALVFGILLFYQVCILVELRFFVTHVETGRAIELAASLAFAAVIFVFFFSLVASLLERNGTSSTETQSSNHLTDCGADITETSLWLTALTLVTILLFLGLNVYGVVQNTAAGDDPRALTGLLSVSGVLIIILYFWYSVRALVAFDDEDAPLNGKAGSYIAWAKVRAPKRIKRGWSDDVVVEIEPAAGFKGRFHAELAAAALTIENVTQQVKTKHNKRSAYRWNCKFDVAGHHVIDVILKTDNKCGSGVWKGHMPHRLQVTSATGQLWLAFLAVAINAANIFIAFLRYGGSF
ncbi:MAG: hypothetical protein ACXV5N_08160 [Halobacteriota archaeon]